MTSGYKSDQIIIDEMVKAGERVAELMRSAERELFMPPLLVGARRPLRMDPFPDDPDRVRSGTIKQIIGWRPMIFNHAPIVMPLDVLHEEHPAGLAPELGNDGAADPGLAPTLGGKHPETYAGRTSSTQETSK